ncbi:hypothetical protein [Hoyosella subflava]|uniref:Uncharacterized protein n=1 Tax=Hoyosella subflava (strain DSM 45089 / JCM 17490 / NBRC 109087 / DQS3-9A1) TaxID=443218 RepID=F6EFP2_HOYSD|nr:hypothetical protein [Hoyosella subflava]AEF40971.1 hypothetical protein AS9A_2524 [Hoyosella subflava DQS3-9A1]
MTTTVRLRAPMWTRIVLAVLAVPQLVTGLWAVINPRHWYDTFPGLGPLLVAAEPPFNAHLATDAGAGFLAVGVVAGVAALWGERRVVLVGGLGFAAFAVPHVLYHAANPAPGLNATANTINVIILSTAALLPLAVVAASLKGRDT